MECERWLRIERDVDLADRLVAGDRAIHAGQRHGDLGVFEGKPHESECGLQLLFRHSGASGRTFLLRILGSGRSAGGCEHSGKLKQSAATQ